MSDPTPRQLEAARAYDALFVPALVGPWAAVVADAADIQAGDQVLDVACGTGVLTREAATRCGPSGQVIGLDPNPGMLAVARSRAPGLIWREGVAESLPVPDRSLDVVVSQFGLMFFTDRHRAIAEMRRVLRPLGRLVVAVWDALPSMPAFAAEVALFERLAGQRAADALRAPFALGDRDVLSRLFVDEMASPPAIETRAGVASFPSIRVLVEADLRGWLPLMGVDLREDVIIATLAQAERALGPHITVGADGAVLFATSVHLVRATA